MQEIELKFQVPPSHRQGLARAMATRTAMRQRLRALYFDTDARDLARAGIALRLRREGTRWVQTLKALGANAIERLEHNVMLPSRAAAPPPLDPRLHEGTPAGERLAAALAAGSGELRCLFHTDIQRTTRQLRTAGVRIEVALDVGRIATESQSLDVHELEFELLSGPVSGLVQAAAAWVKRHGLWLDIRSKAERGDRLARAGASLPAPGAPVKAARSELQRTMAPDAALRAMVAQAIGQVLGNAAEVADDRFDADHVHQLRVGLRRLRSLLRELHGWSGDLQAHWEPALAEAFGQLGGTRDRDVIAATWLARLADAGLVEIPVGELPPPDDAAPGRVVRGLAFQWLMLELLGFAAGSPPAPVAEVLPMAEPGPPPGLDEAFAASLRRQWRRMRPDAKRFAEIDDEARHRLRKRLKRLRYVSEFAAPLWKAKRVGTFLAALREAQEALGAYNDDLVAHAHFAERAAAEPRLWFAIGWIAARRTAALRDGDRSLALLLETRRFWKD